MVLISHSTPKALVMAKENEMDESTHAISSSVAGAIFLGTPHRGSGFASFGIVRSLLSYWKGSRTELLELMSSRSSDIDDLHDAFLNMYPLLRICNFFETVPATIYGIPLQPVRSPFCILPIFSFLENG